MTIFTENQAKGDELSLSDLDAAVGGHSNFHYVEMNGNTYAIGHIKGQTVIVKVT
jgi:hypothetical protein